MGATSVAMTSSHGLIATGVAPTGRSAAQRLASRTGSGTLHRSIWPAGRTYQPSRRLRRASVAAAKVFESVRSTCSGVHHAYIAPAMLRMAVEGAVRRHAPLTLAQGLFA